MSKYKLWRALRGGVWRYEYSAIMGLGWVYVPKFRQAFTTETIENYLGMSLLQRIGVVK